MIADRPRIVFSALRGNSGKTFLTVGVGASLRQRGRKVSPFKKGPDYIDPSWLEMATGQRCYNLDLFLMERRGVLASFCARSGQADGALIEGNRGLFDGMDRDGTFSTAELAKLLKAPVILIADCSMATRTVAAAILGCQHFDSDVAIRGVILNRIGGNRHESLVRSTIEERCGIPVLGAVPKIKEGFFPQRHMGLIPPREYPQASRAIEQAAAIADRYLDVDRLWGIAQDAPVLRFDDIKDGDASLTGSSGKLRIGFIRDSAFWFYYPDNLEAIEAAGASLVECSALNDREIPQVDALYIGGGFPETHAAALAANIGFRNSLREAVEAGLPVYAECGGLMYLGRELVVGEQTFPMAGVFPIRLVVEGTPQGHGYTILKVDRRNPYFQTGETLHGHEFHYSRIADGEQGAVDFAFDVARGHGIQGRRDGLSYRNVLATYSHIHAAGTKGWVNALLGQAEAYRMSKNREAAPVVASIPGTSDRMFAPGLVL